MKYLERIERILGRTTNFLYYIRIGRSYGYPLCCVLHFAWDAVQKKAPALRRGSIRISHNKAYVPCAFHTGRHPKWKPYLDGPIDQLQFKESPREAQDRR